MHYCVHFFHSVSQLKILSTLSFAGWSSTWSSTCWPITPTWPETLAWSLSVCPRTPSHVTGWSVHGLHQRLQATVTSSCLAPSLRPSDSSCPQQLGLSTGPLTSQRWWSWLRGTAWMWQWRTQVTRPWDCRYIITAGTARACMKGPLMSTHVQVCLQHPLSSEDIPCPL